MKRRNLYLFIWVGIITSTFIGCATDEKPKSRQWKIARQSDWEARFYDVFFIDEKTGWAVGNHEGNTAYEVFESVIAHTTDGGKTWEPQRSGVHDHPLREVQFVDAQKGWIAGENGIILHTKDSGETWVKQTTNTSNALFDLQFLSAEEGWAVGDWGTALYTKNGGDTWVNRAEGIGKDSLRGIYFLDSQHGWSVTINDRREGYVYHTQDGGETWKRQKVDLPRIYTEGFSDVYFVDRNTGWVIGNRRVILGTTDGGETWNYLTENSNKRHEETYGQRNPTGDEPLHTFMLYDLSFPDPRNGWIAGDLGVILHTSNGGKTWSHQRGGPRLHAGGDSLILGIHFINNQQGYSVL